MSDTEEVAMQKIIKDIMVLVIVWAKFDVPTISTSTYPIGKLRMTSKTVDPLLK